MLVQTSMANRTSPVLRGKWVMEVLLGTPPPPPPPDVPDLEAAGEAKEGRMLTTRERMEIHRSNPTCNSCHRMMDPIGLALDNFDVTGQAGAPANSAARSTPAASSTTGRRSTSPRELVDALLKRPTPLVRTFTENLTGVRTGPPRRILRPADHPRHRPGRPKPTTTGCLRSSSGIVKSDPFRMKRVEAAVTTDDDQGRRKMGE